jgi:hypothetical protein
MNPTTLSGDPGWRWTIPNSVAVPGLDSCTLTVVGGNATN